MKFQEKFNEVCVFPNYLDQMDEFHVAIERSIMAFNDEYKTFKKEHGLENLYFSSVLSVSNYTDGVTEVAYLLSDLYLTYLEANNCLPDGAMVESFIFKDYYLYNTPNEWMFRDSMIAASNQRSAPKTVGGAKVYRAEDWRGLTERIKLSAPIDGMPSMIIDRLPMTYDDLKNLNTK